MTSDPRRRPIPLVEPGALGPAPVRQHPAGTWPEGVPRQGGGEQGRISRWAIARAGTVFGDELETLWLEHGVDSVGNAVTIPVHASATWPVCKPCPLTLVDCDRYGCREAGGCRRPQHEPST